MKRLTYRDNEGRAQWAPELLEDNTGMAGSVIRSFVADVEDILGGRSRSESVKRFSISGKAETISDYGKFKIPPPAGTKEKERPSYMDLYQRLTAIEDILGDEYDLDRLRELVQADREGRCVVLNMPRKPLVWGDDEKNTCLCPYCGKDLMGIPYGERMVLQCPECGQYLDATKVITRSEAELRREE